jgi:PAS domain S-box-containing protein
MERYGIAVIACAVAFAVAWLTGAQSSCLFLAVMVSGFYGGEAPGLLSVGLSALAFSALISWWPQFPLAAAPSRGLRFGVFVGAALLVNHLISIKRRSDEARRESDEYYRIVAEAATDAILSFDEKKQIVFANEAARKIFGWSVSDLIGRPLSMVMKDFPRDGTSTITEVVGLRSDGTEFPAEISFAEVVRNGQRNITGFVRDISERRQAQAILRKSESYLAEAQKLSHTGSCGLNVATGEVFWSEETYRITGLEVGTKPTMEMVLKLVHPDDRRYVQETLDLAIRDETEWSVEHRLLMPDGSVKYMHVVAHPVRNELNQIEYIGAATDITGAKQAEEALRGAFDAVRRSEDQLRLIIDTIPALAWSSASNGSLEFANRRWREYTGLSTEEAQGIGWKAAIYADDLAHLVEVWSAALVSGKASECEARLRRFDGKYRWFLFRTVPLRDENGSVAKWYGTNTDIEDRKLAEEAVRESEHNLSLIIDTIPALVWCAVPDGRLEYVNQRIVDYLGVPVSDLIEHGWTNFLHPDDVEPTLRSWFHAVATGTRHEVEYRMCCSDGAYRWFHVLGQPFRNQEGRIVRWYGLLADIQDRKNVAETLRRTQGRLSQAMQIATIGEFAASIAHEVNQPLAAVVTNGHACLRWLQTQPPNLTEAKLAAERIIRSGNSAAEVVRRIRALFTQSEPEKVPLNLNEAIAEVVHLLTGDILRQGVVVETELVEELPPVMADRLQLQQVIFNLLQNGIESMDKLTGHPKKLVIRSKRQGSAILIEIRDYGSGLKDYEKPFEAFYTTKESGMGMGLAICRSILGAHRGWLWAKPTEGPGATFCLTLPLNAETPATNPAISSSSS